MFQDAQVTQIFCLGDVINTREHVNVQALSATARFFDDLHQIAPVHIVLGNHDMNLKHSSRVSSLDVFGSEGYKGSCKLYRDMADVDVEGVKCLMVPWVENHSVFVDRLTEMPEEEKCDRILFGHLAVSGAVQQPSAPVTSRYRTHSGVLKGRHLVSFRASYLGHFHHHQELVDGKVWYVGSPMQHHFGDKADASRGILLLQPTETSTNEPPGMQFIQNPKWDFFREVSLQELRSKNGGLELPFDVVGKRINVRCTAIDAPEFEKGRARLVEAGAGDVRRKVEIGRGIFSPVPAGDQQTDKPSNTGEASGEPASSSRKNATQVNVEEALSAPTTATFVEALPDFLNSIPKDSELIPEDQRPEYIATAERLMRLADSATSEGSSSATSTASSLPIFQATIKTLTMTNFFSVQGTLTIPFHKLTAGTWFLTGPNGAGKSTVLEAITWCLFGEVLRSDMGAGDPVNDVVGKNCCVRIDFENGYSIERFRKFLSKGVGRGPGLKLYKNGEEVADFERGESRKTQAALERDILGCDFATFTKSVIFGDQGGGAGNFLTLDIKQRRDVLEELLGITNFEGYLKTVRDERREIEKEHFRIKSHSETVASEVQRLEADQYRFQSMVAPKEQQKEDLTQQLRVLDQDVSKFEDDRAQIEQEQGEIIKWNKVYSNLQRLQEAKRGVEAQLRLRQEKVQEARDAMTKIEESRPLRSRWTTSLELLELAKKELRTKKLDHEIVGDRALEISQTLETFNEKMEMGVCPTCQQSLADPAHVREHIDGMEGTKQDLHEREMAILAEIDRINSEILHHEESQASIRTEMAEKEVTPGYLATLTDREREVRSILLSSQGPIRKFEIDVQKAEKDIKSVLGGKTMDEVAELAHRQGNEDISTLQRVMQTHAKLLRRIQELSARRTMLTSSLARTTTEVKHALSQLEVINTQLATFSEELADDANKLAELDRQLRILLFWETAFNKKQATTSAPNMRHFLISTSINELNTLIMSNMEILTNPTNPSPTGLSAAPDLPISFTPDLSIYPPSSFGKRSSGQRKRNNLAVLFALFQLIRQKSRFRADFIMLDEVFDALDKEGQIQAAELISAVSTEGAGRISGGEVKHVLVVTHSEALEDVVRVGDGGAGARVIKVEMGPRGTDMVDPEGVIEHTWSAVSGEEGIPEIAPPPTEKKKRAARTKKVKEVQDGEGAGGEELGAKGTDVTDSEGVSTAASGEEGTVEIPKEKKKRGPRAKKVKDVVLDGEGAGEEVDGKLASEKDETPSAPTEKKKRAPRAKKVKDVVQNNEDVEEEAALMAEDSQ